MLRNKNLTETDAKLRIDSQLSNSQRLKNADHQIDNSNSLENTRRQIKDLNEIFRKSKKYIFIRLGLISLTFLLVSGVILIPFLTSFI